MGEISVATRYTDHGITCGFFCRGQQVASVELTSINNDIVGPFVIGHVYDADGETLVKFTEKLEDTNEGTS
jgi:hypothetical protein